MTLISVHAASGSCSHGQVIACHLGSIASGASDTITIVARPTTTGQLRNTGSVASATADANPSNNIAHASTQIRPGPAALRLTKSANVRQAGPGQAFSFTITVGSLGPAPALNLRVCDRLGSGMTYISVDHATFHHGVPCWKISSLAKGKRRSFLVWVRGSTANGPRPLANVATASADGVRTRTVRATVHLVGVAPPPSVTG